MVTEMHSFFPLLNRISLIFKRIDIDPYMNDDDKGFLWQNKQTYPSIIIIKSKPLCLKNS